MAAPSGPLEIAIAGCGPAGLAAALLLHHDGHRVTLFERFDAPRPVGSGLMIQPTGVAVLARLGLAERLMARGARIDALLGLQEKGRIALDARYDELGIPGAFGIGVHRASLFAVLYDEVLARGIAVRTGHEAVRVCGSPQRPTLVFADGARSAGFDLAIDATGWNTRLQSGARNPLAFGALWTTLPMDGCETIAPHRLEQRYRRAARMAGVLPIGRRTPDGPEEVAFFWSLRADLYPQWRTAPLDAWKAEVVREWPQIAPLMSRIEDHDDLTFARYAHRSCPQPRGGAHFVIGDAWHSASPQLGQGANMALLDAWALAAGLREGRTIAEGLRLARAWRSGHVALYQAVTEIFTPLYQSDAKWPALLRDNILAPLSRVAPITRLQAMLMSGMFGWPLRPLGLDPPDYAAIASSSAPRTSGSAQSTSPTTRQTSLPDAS